MKGLALSGGGSRGSFQAGALECLYKVFDYRPDVIAGTSVGSVNGIALAQETDPILQLAQLNKLLDLWRSLTSTIQFYINRPAVGEFFGSPGLNLSEGFSFDNVTLFNASTLQTALSYTSLAVLDPLELLLRNPTLLDIDRLRTGLPLWMATVSLETGRLRYVTNRGEFVEDDGKTPVASALEPNPLLEPAQSVYTNAMTEVRLLSLALSSIKKPSSEYYRISLALTEARRVAESALNRVAARNDGLVTLFGFSVKAPVDPVRGALASAAIPGVFGPYSIGNENYVDGGVRENVPVRAAIQMGATEVVAIICSTQQLPKVDDASRRTVLENMLGALTNITLKEIVEDDVRGRGIGQIPVKVIIPNFDVHDTAEVDNTLIHISMDYGFMRAADVMSPIDESSRILAILLSDNVARLRVQTHLEWQSWGINQGMDIHINLRKLRLLKWMLNELVKFRVRSGVPMPDTAKFWFQSWEVGARNTDGYTITPWQDYTDPIASTPTISPFDYVPDSWVYQEVGDFDGVYLVRAGAVFRTNEDALAATGVTTIVPRFTLPEGISRFLPTVPVALTVLVETGPGAASGTWFIRGGKRFLLPTSPIPGVTLSAPASIPVGGLNQIPFGGTPYFFGSLVLIDLSTTTPIEVWEPTPQRETTTTTTTLTLFNRAPYGGPSITVMNLVVDTSPEATFTLKGPSTFTLQPQEAAPIDIDFTANRPGRVTGSITIESNDPIAPAIIFPISTSVTAIGPRGIPKFGTGELDFGSLRVGSSIPLNLRIENVGQAPLTYRTSLVEETVSGQFGIPFVAGSGQLDVGSFQDIAVSFIPSTPGRFTAVLVIDTISQTSSFPVQEVTRVQLVGSAVAPQIALVAEPRSTVFLRTLTGTIAAPSIVQEVTELDFGVKQPNEESRSSFWIRNVGDADLNIRGFVVENQLYFGLSDETWKVVPVTLKPNEEIEASLVFRAPGSAGSTVYGAIQIISDDPVRGSASLNVRGSSA